MSVGHGARLTPAAWTSTVTSRARRRRLVELSDGSDVGGNVQLESGDAASVRDSHIDGDLAGRTSTGSWSPPPSPCAATSSSTATTAPPGCPTTASMETSRARTTLPRRPAAGTTCPATARSSAAACEKPLHDRPTHHRTRRPAMKHHGPPPRPPPPTNAVRRRVAHRDVRRCHRTDAGGRALLRCGEHLGRHLRGDVGHHRLEVGAHCRQHRLHQGADRPSAPPVRQGRPAAARDEAPGPDGQHRRRRASSASRRRTLSPTTRRA